MVSYPDFTGLFVTDGDATHEVYEGFPSELVFGSYEQNPRKWSAEIRDDYRLWATIFLIMRSLSAV